MTPKEKALKLCQAFGITTLFAQDCNGGVTLPLSIAKKCALIAAKEVVDNCNYSEDKNYWVAVIAEIEKL